VLGCRKIIFASKQLLYRKIFVHKPSLEHLLRVTLYKKNDSLSNGNLLDCAQYKTLREMEPGNSQSGVCSARRLITAWKESRLLISLGRKCRYFRAVKGVDIVSVNCTLFADGVADDAHWTIAIVQSTAKEV